MENKIVIYGFDETEQLRLQEEIPAQYDLCPVDDVTEMIVNTALCYLIRGDGLSAGAYRLFRNYCMEVAGYTDTLVVWIGSNCPCETVTVFSQLSDFLKNTESVLQEAKIHYRTQTMYSTPYAVLPKSAIEARLEEAILSSLQWRYSKHPDPKITKRMCQEWGALLEADAAVEFAAVHELSIWLCRNEVPFYMEGSVTSGLIPYLLGITKVNPLSKELGGHDLVWQSFCGYGHSPDYRFHLPFDVKDQIERWIEMHWLKELYLDGIEAMLHRLERSYRFHLNARIASRKCENSIEPHRFYLPAWNVFFGRFEGSGSQLFAPAWSKDEHEREDRKSRRMSHKTYVHTDEPVDILHFDFYINHMFCVDGDKQSRAETQIHYQRRQLIQDLILFLFAVYPPDKQGTWTEEVFRDAAKHYRENYPVVAELCEIQFLVLPHPGKQTFSEEDFYSQFKQIYEIMEENEELFLAEGRKSLIGLRKQSRQSKKLATRQNLHG